MPIFEYNCRSCDHHFETIVLSAREKISCPKCASKKVDKQLSVFSAPASTSDAVAQRRRLHGHAANLRLPLVSGRANSPTNTILKV